MRLVHPSRALAIGLALSVLAVPGTALGADRTPPSVNVAGDTMSRCDGGLTRLKVHVFDGSNTHTVVRRDGRRVRTTSDKRFRLKLKLDGGNHTIRIFVRDASQNRYKHTLTLLSCG
jgi:hypothetical protein